SAVVKTEMIVSTRLTIMKNEEGRMKNEERDISQFFILHSLFRLLADDHVARFQALENLQAIFGLNADLDGHAALAVTLAPDDEAAAFKGAHSFRGQPEHILLALQHDPNLGDRARRQLLALGVGHLDAGGAILLLDGTAAA